MVTVSRRILFVEDHDDTRTMLTRLLEQAGHFVIAAENAAVGLALAQLEIMRWCRSWMRPWRTRRKEAATGWLAVRGVHSAAWGLSPSINSMQRGCKTGCAISKSGRPSVRSGCESGHASRWRGWPRSFPATRVLAY